MIRITACDAGHATEAVALAQRAVAATTGQDYSPAQVAVWLRGMTVERFTMMFAGGATAAVSAVGAFEGDRMLGFATLVASDERLDLLYVDPAAWRRGVARRLVEAIEERARAAGCTRLRVDSSRLAQKALASLGYEAVADHTKTVGGVTFDNKWLEKAL